LRALRLRRWSPASLVLFWLWLAAGVLALTLLPSRWLEAGPTSFAGVVLLAAAHGVWCNRPPTKVRVFDPREDPW
jgi:hypothetical protein